MYSGTAPPTLRSVAAMKIQARPRPRSLTAWGLVTASAALWFLAALGAVAYTVTVVHPSAQPPARYDGDRFGHLVDTVPDTVSALFCGLSCVLPGGLALAAAGRYARGDTGATTAAAVYGCAHAAGLVLLTSWGPWQAGATALPTITATVGGLGAAAAARSHRTERRPA